MNTVENLYIELMELAKLRHVVIRYNDTNSLVMFKYSRRAFWNNLWGKFPALKEARGIVFTNPETTGRCELVTRPFTKVFNLGENGTDLDPTKPYNVYRKVNGFMAAVSWNPIELEWMVTTTGSFHSAYVKMAEDKLMQAISTLGAVQRGFTFLFEIVHENDPHIVEETPGAYLLLARANTVYEKGRDILTEKTDLFIGTCYRDDILRSIKSVSHEGFAIYDESNSMVAKIKSSHYLVKKFLMRVKGEKIALIWEDFEKAKRTFTDEEFWPVMRALRAKTTHSEFVGLSEQQRRSFLENL